jgi:hypothetical protein
VTRAPRVLFLLALAGGMPAAAGPALVIYRCVAADGAVTLQNGTKCAKGMHEQKRIVDTPSRAPLPTPARIPAPAPVAPSTGAVAATSSPAATAPAMPTPGAPAVASATSTDTPQAPPTAPMLYACLTRDAQRYFSDAAESSRCAPLQAVGLDGRSAGAGDACEVVQDRCEPVPEAERCAAWAERRRAAEQALTFVPEQVDAARAELDRVDEAIRGTPCAR